MSSPLHVRLGFVPLTDCAPLVVALELGLFAEQGLDVELSKEASWATLRDRVAVGDLTGAHMLAALPLATRLGLAGLKADLVCAVALGRNGNGITVARRHADAATGDPARSAGAVVAAARKQRQRPRFAMVHPFSTHHYLLRHWLEVGGVDPDRDVTLVVVPPPLVGAALKAGQIDGFCVGEPWNSIAHRSGAGRFLLGTGRLWSQHPEKVLAVREDWCRDHHDAHLGLIRALVAAARWIEGGDHWRLTAEILAAPHYLHARAADLRPLDPDTGSEADRLATTFHRGCATFPWQSQALWYLQQMQQVNQLETAVDAHDAVRATYRGDLYREALAASGEPLPAEDLKLEGAHQHPYSIPALDGGTIEVAADAFLDRPGFDPGAVPTILEAASEVPS